MDDYERSRRELDLIFQEIDDRALLAQREDVVAKLSAYSSARREIDEIRVALLKNGEDERENERRSRIVGG